MDKATLQELKASNQTALYWLWDQPEQLTTKKNYIYYYPNAGKLVCRLPTYINAGGNESLGKLAGLDLSALRNTPGVIERLIEILQAVKEQGEKAAPLENDKAN